MTTPRPYEIAVIFPLLEELRYAYHVFGQYRDVFGPSAKWHKLKSRRQQNTYYLLEWAKNKEYQPASHKEARNKERRQARPNDLRIWFTSLPEMGNGPAQDLTTELIDLIAPDMVFGVGIAGSLDADLMLGDVACARIVSDIIDAAKIGDPRSFDGRPPKQYELYVVSRSIDAFKPYVAFYSAAEFLDPVGFSNWQERCRKRASEIGCSKEKACAKPPSTEPAAREEYLRFLSQRDWPKAHTGRFASGVVLSSEAFEVKRQGREYNVIETEAAGIARACTNGLRPTPFAILRGISDYAGGQKGELQTTSFGAWRRLAVFNALELLLRHLRIPAFEGILEEARRAKHAQTARGFDKIQERTLDEAREQIENLCIFLETERSGGRVRLESKKEDLRGNLKHWILSDEYPAFVEALAALRIDRDLEQERDTLRLLMDYSSYLANFANANQVFGRYVIDRCFELFEGYFAERFRLHPQNYDENFPDQHLREKYHRCRSVNYESQGFLRRAIEHRSYALETGETIIYRDRDRNERCLLCMKAQLLSHISEKDRDVLADGILKILSKIREDYEKKYNEANPGKPSPGQFPKRYWLFQAFRTAMVEVRTAIQVELDPVDLAKRISVGAKLLSKQEKDTEGEANCDWEWQTAILEFYTGIVLYNVESESQRRCRGRNGKHYNDVEGPKPGEDQGMEVPKEPNESQPATERTDFQETKEWKELTKDLSTLGIRTDLTYKALFSDASKKFQAANVSSLCLVRVSQRLRQMIQLSPPAF
jgi:nucleoside phosphorylase